MDMWNDDILSKINEFIIDLTDILNLKHTCRLFYYHIYNISYDGKYKYIKEINDNIVSIYLDDENNYNDVLTDKIVKLWSEYNPYLDNETLNKLTNLTELSINSNIVNDISKLINLTSLDVSSNTGISMIELIDLKHLGNNISYDEDDSPEICISNESIMKLINLKSLTTRVSAYVTGECLKYLNLTSLDCALDDTVLDCHLIHLTNLIKLDCSACTITDFSVKQLTSLEVLHCRGCYDLTDRSILNLTKLKTLCCPYTSISDRSIVQLNSLTELDCSNTQVSDKSIRYLVNLTTLICKNNKNITHNSTKCLTNLIKLNCAGSSIKDFGNNYKLKFLDCSFQNIYDNNLRNVTLLEELYCHETYITIDLVKSLTNLKILECDLQESENINLEHLYIYEDI